MTHLHWAIRHVPLPAAIVMLLGLGAHQANEAGQEPKRINKAIELLDRGQPIYYTQIDRGGYTEGLKMARTWADYVSYNLEHSTFDVGELREFMRGLVDGGPTPSGHRTPAVICVLPVGGYDEATMRANHWMVSQALAAGVHGLLLVHARSPEAVASFVQAARYPTHRQAVGSGLGEGLRGSGGQGYAARIWGVSADEYVQLADPWPLNPAGELLLGVKIEDRHALANAERTARVPGLGFGEWGRGDMALSFQTSRLPDGTFPPVLSDARARVRSALQSAGISFLDSVTADDIEAMIDEGVMVGAGGREAAERGRRYTDRQMPW